MPATQKRFSKTAEATVRSRMAEMENELAAFVKKTFREKAKIEFVFDEGGCEPHYFVAHIRKFRVYVSLTICRFTEADTLVLKQQGNGFSPTLWRRTPKPVFEVYIEYPETKKQKDAEALVLRKLRGAPVLVTNEEGWPGETVAKYNANRRREESRRSVAQFKLGCFVALLVAGLMSAGLEGM